MRVHAADAPRGFQHEEYFASSPPEVQPILRRIQATVQAAVPQAEACISYKMPAFRLGKVFFYFAAFKHHIGIYPPVAGSEGLRAQLAPYLGPKGNLIFPLAQPMPYELIEQVALALAAQYGGPTRRRKPERVDCFRAPREAG